MKGMCDVAGGVVIRGRHLDGRGAKERAADVGWGQGVVRGGAGADRSVGCGGGAGGSWVEGGGEGSAACEGLEQQWVAPPRTPSHTDLGPPPRRPLHLRSYLFTERGGRRGCVMKERKGCV